MARAGLPPFVVTADRKYVACPGYLDGDKGKLDKRLRVVGFWEIATGKQTKHVVAGLTACTALDITADSKTIVMGDAEGGVRQGVPLHDDVSLARHLAFRRIEAWEEAAVLHAMRARGRQREAQ